MTKMRMLSRLSSQLCVYAMLLCASLTANALPIIYDFNGTGVLNIYTGIGNNYVTEQRSFSGTVTMDVLLSEAPFYFPPLRASGNGWVDAQFDIHWDGGGFRPADYGTGYTFTELFNRPAQDEITMDQFATSIPGRYIKASLTRVTDDVTWLTDLNFVHQGLAPGAYNVIRFDNIPSSSIGPTSGFWGNINLSSLNMRETSVPEPATLGLFGLGLVASLFARRIRKS